MIVADLIMGSTNRIRELRTERGLSQQDLAERLGISKFEISRLETGGTRLNVERAVSIAKALDSTLDELLGIAVQDQIADEAIPYQPRPNDPFIRLARGKHERIYVITQATLDELGIQAGDICLVDISPISLERLAAGATVFAHVKGAKSRERPIMVARQFIKPNLLITNSRRHNLPPLNIITDRAEVVGVVTSWHRSLARDS